MPKYILTYFPISGRAQVARLMFEVSGIEYQDERIPMNEWPVVKSDETRFPLNQMPTLRVDGEIMCQSLAIFRYLASSFDLYGDSLMDKADTDQICETFDEYFKEPASVLRDKTISAEDKASLADFFFLAQNSMMEYILPTYLDGYPELKALIDRIKSIEAVKKHLEAEAKASKW